MNNPTSTPKSAPRSRSKLALATAAAVAVFFVLSWAARHGATRPSVPGTEPFEIEPLLSARRCSVPAPNTASRHAQGLEQIAHARMQRAAFVPSEGIHAAQQLSEAGLCFAQAGSKEDQQRVHEQWLSWKRELLTRFQGHRLRLKLALKNKRSADALFEIDALRALLASTAATTNTTLREFLTSLDFEQRRLTAQPKKR